MKLNARMMIVTGIDGTSSHGEIASAWMFCACWSSTPQLIAGGRSPRTREESGGLAIVIGGMGRGGGGEMGPREDGTRLVKMIRVRVQAGRSAAIKKSSSRSDREPAADHAGQLGPADQRDDDRD